MYFLTEHDDLLKKIIIIFEISNSMKNKLDCEPIYNKKFLKTKIKSYGDADTDFCNKEISKVESNYNSLAVVLIDVVLKKIKNYYQQVLLKECKYIEKEKEVARYITDDLQNFSHDSDKE